MTASPRWVIIATCLDALPFVAPELGILGDMAETSNPPTAANFVHDVVVEHNATGAFGGRVQTRFPPEPNGYLHIGHAKAITADFELAREFNGVCRLRFDDTNPDTEDASYVAGIIEDLAWLGYPLDRDPLFTSDYFTSSQSGPSSSSRMAWHTSTTKTATRSPNSVADTANRESTARFGVGRSTRTLRCSGMRAGDFDEGAHVLRAKIDMQHENMQLRDPVMYRIRKESHHRTGDAWSVYPTYDWAHGQSDAIEGVTHSLCSLEFDSHRALYDWYLDQLRELAALPFDQPRQYEFARLELTHTVTSKRKLATLVADGVVDGWDDPRLPTLRGLRRRGYPAVAIREFCRLHRRVEDQQPPRDRAARVLYSDATEQGRSAANGRAGTVEGRHHELADRRGRQSGGRVRRAQQQP